MKDPVEQLRARLWGEYQAAPEECRAIVNLLAVNWGSLPKQDIRNALRAVVGKTRGNRLEPSEWVELGLVGVQTSWNGGERFYCNPLLTELVVRRLVADGGFATFVELARTAFPIGRSYLRNNTDPRFESDDQLIREIRIGLYQRDEAYIDHLFQVLRRNQYSHWDGLAGRWPGPEPVYALVCADPFDLDWFRQLPEGIQRAALAGVVDIQVTDWRLAEDAYRLLLEAGRDPASPRRDHDLYSAAYAALLRGEAATVEGCLRAAGRGGSMEAALEALLGLLTVGLDDGIRRFEEALKLLRKLSGRRKAMLEGIPGVLYVLALTLRNRGTDMDEARKLVELVNDKDSLWPLYRLLKLALAMEAGEKGALESFRATLLRCYGEREIEPWGGWLGLFILHRYDANPDVKPYLGKAMQQYCLARSNGLQWLAAELGELLAVLDPSQQGLAESAREFQAGSGYTLLVSRVCREAPWERALNAIGNMVTRAVSVKENADGESRLAWFLRETPGYFPGFQLEVREQKRAAGGSWSKGKVLSLKKLAEQASGGAYLSDQDRRIASHITVDRLTRSHELSERGWLALVGHPRGYDAVSGGSLELAGGEPELRVSRSPKGDSIRLEFWPRLKQETGLVLCRDGFNRIKIIEIKPEHRRLAEIVGAGISAPAEAQERIAESLGVVASLVTIHSDIGSGGSSAAAMVEADSAPRLQLLPEGDGLRVALLVRPFGDRGSYLVPGSGNVAVIAEIDGHRLQTRRDLERERALAREVIEACPGLAGERSVAEGHWLLADVESSLELLLELGELGDKVRLEWPQGQKFRVAGQAGLSRFSLSLRQQRDWFTVQGELRLDGGEVIEMQRLLELLDQRRGRFIELDEGRFLALTEAFRKRLEDLRSYAEKHGKEQRVTALAAPILDEIAGEVGEFTADAAWRKQLERLQEAERIQPRVPSTLQAELRDYQKEGFAWLVRLAAWGVGACLADDMGLGKTLQAIALILSRAGGGPSLVVAPTSVCFNWHNEAARFAPTLAVKTLDTDDRQQLLTRLQPYDLLVCSYGLLQQEAVGELLAGVPWRTIVLDEAQAIKNPATKRAKQALGLQGEFKLITTGTPVENHLGELWALFRFINPGLLGSLESFNRRFAAPIERYQDRDARQRLKRLIQPFILRRTKAQVLDELPPRTEIELQVELSEPETVFYEGLRKKLLEELGAAAGGPGDQRFLVLAAITKLRRACCNPALVAPELELSSSKLALFGEVLEELLENRHKALVFSQFVDHLAIVRDYLGQRGIGYQYLDGQTPAGDRKKRVEAFQSGEGDVFLISLKAGGTGLNLTAADYVIHLDPWWNPAVEDQASDRAHRIGQQRPVTVYRLVTKGTIEEQIVSLHRHKRDLADSLLAGGEMSGKLAAEELLRLIRNG